VVNASACLDELLKIREARGECCNSADFLFMIKQMLLFT